MPRLLNEQVAVLLGLFIVAAALYVSTFGQNYSSVDTAQSPVFFPRIILGLWMGLCLIALVQAARQIQASKPVHNWSRVVILLVAVVIYTNVIGREGFFLPSVIFAAISLPLFGVRNPLIVGFYSISVPLALVLLFNHTLKMPLPVSRFTHLF